MGMQVLSYLRQTLKKRDKRDASKDNDWDFGAHQTLDITAADAEVKNARRRSVSLDGAQKRSSPMASETAAAGLGTVARPGANASGHERQHSQVSASASVLLVFKFLMIANGCSAFCFLACLSIIGANLSLFLRRRFHRSKCPGAPRSPSLASIEPRTDMHPPCSTSRDKRICLQARVRDIGHLPA